MKHEVSEANNRLFFFSRSSGSPRAYADAGSSNLLTCWSLSLYFTVL